MAHRSIKCVAGLALALLLAGCGGPAPRSSPEGPFDFREIERMAREPAATERDARAIALSYQQTLQTFDAMYGGGVGPAKGTAAWRGCRQSFDAVGLFAGAPSSASAETIGERLPRALLACRRASERWTHAAEMATFGNDVRQMTAGSLIVLGNALRRADEPARGWALIEQGLALLREDRGSGPE